MRVIELTSITGMTPPITVEVCNVFVENCVLFYQSPSVITVPPSIFLQLPIQYETLPVVLLKITDQRGCVVTQVKYCVENIVPPLYPYCDNCGSVDGFLSNAVSDGLYADDSSQYLIQFSAGSIQNAFEIDFTGTIPVAQTATGYRTIVNGKLFLNYISASTDYVAVYDTPGNLLTTFSLGSIACGGIEYDPSVNKIFFSYNPSPFTDRRIGYFDPDTYAIVYDVASNYGGGFAFPYTPHCNPITFEKYVGTGNYRIYVLSSGLGSSTPLVLKATISGAVITWGASNQPRQSTFNTQTGEIWIVSDFTGNTQEIVVVDPYTYSATAVNQSCISTTHTIFGSKPIAYYPGDGTIGSDKMFVLYVASGFTDYKIVQFDTSPPYNNSVFYYDVSSGSANKNLYYSSIFNKLFYTSNSTIDVFDPTDSSVDLCPTLTLPYTTARYALDDPTNELIFFPTTTTTIFWLGLDENNAVRCNEGIIDFYSSNNGPYKFNTTTLVWDSMCTTNVSYNTPVVNRFTIDAQIGGFADEAYLSYSSTSVADWTPLSDINGDVVINSTNWVSGLSYSDPDTSFILRVTFVVDGSCELYGPVI